MKKISIYTQIDAPSKHLRRCIEGVLSQTFGNFEYIIMDNTDSDADHKILADFAARDRRIRWLRTKSNHSNFWLPILKELASGHYCTVLNPEDWWEPDYLKRMLHFVSENDLDLAMAGYCVYQEQTGEEELYQSDQPLLLPWERFADAFPLYYSFLKHIRNKLFKTDLLLGLHPVTQETVVYGQDFILGFQALRGAKRIGIDNSSLYHTPVENHTIPCVYPLEHFDTDIFLYHEAFLFLSAYGPISPRNQQFLQKTYGNAVKETLSWIDQSALPSKDKLREYRRIATHPLTIALYSLKECADLHPQLLDAVLYEALQIPSGNDDICALFFTLSPRCGRAIWEKNWRLFCQEKSLRNALLKDDQDTMIQLLMDLIVSEQYFSEYDFGLMLHCLLEQNSPLHFVADTYFFQIYADICQLIFLHDYVEALEQMTGLLLEHIRLYQSEAFLQLYLILAALENQTSAFLFGNIQLAQFHLRQKNYARCRAILSDLEEMGLSDHPEIQALRRSLGSFSPI